MAKGRKCPECGMAACADREDYQPRGNWVMYVCRRGSCPSVKRGFPWKERVFEAK